MEILKTGSDALFILLGAIMVLAMHAGFAFPIWEPDLGGCDGPVAELPVWIAELGDLTGRVQRIHSTTSHPSPARTQTSRTTGIHRWRSLNADERNPGLPNPHRAGG